MKALGIDLAGSERRNSGVAYLEDGKLTCSVLHKDEEILELSKGFFPYLHRCSTVFAKGKG